MDEVLIKREIDKLMLVLISDRFAKALGEDGLM